MQAEEEQVSEGKGYMRLNLEARAGVLRAPRKGETFWTGQKRWNV